MGKRGADGDAVDPEGAEPRPEPFPEQLVRLSYAALASPQTHVATHIGPDGTVVLWNEHETLVGNLRDQGMRYRFDSATTRVHGILTDSASGKTAVCCSIDTTVLLYPADVPGEALFVTTMPEAVCCGSIGVYGDVFVAVSADRVRVVAVYPFVSPVQLAWVAPSPVLTVVRCRDGPPVIALGDKTTWRLEPASPGIQFTPIAADLLEPTEAKGVDFSTNIWITATALGQCAVLVSRGYPHLNDVVLPISPVAAAWEGRWLFVLGETDPVSHGLEVWAVTPSIGAVCGTYTPEHIGMAPGAFRQPVAGAPETDELGDFCTIAGRYVLWYGQAYILGSPERGTHPE